MNTNGWEQLDCRYFAETCREVVSDYLGSHGFSEKGLTNGGGIIYKRSDVFLELNYDTNLYPKYCFTSLVVIGDEYPNKQGGFSYVPLWYLVPSDHPYRALGSWMFSSKDELARVLEEVRTDFLETTLVPLLLNREKTEQVIKSFHSEFCCYLRIATPPAPSRHLLPVAWAPSKHMPRRRSPSLQSTAPPVTPSPGPALGKWKPASVAQPTLCPICSPLRFVRGAAK